MKPSRKKKEEMLLAQVRRGEIPHHIAVIMDGNGRWAKKHGFRSRISGHRAGIESVKEITRACGEIGVKFLTLYAFSKENWQRPRSEIIALMKLLERFLVKERKELMKNNVKLGALGALKDLPLSVRKVLDSTIELTSKNTGLHLLLALSYGGRAEIIEAIKKIVTVFKKNNVQNVNSINSTTFKQYLYAPYVPDPDLLIRTSGEMRISNFLLWQIAYTEIYVTDTLWPDFRKIHLLQAVKEYQRRERRFGTVKPE